MKDIEIMLELINNNNKFSDKVELHKDIDGYWLTLRNCVCDLMGKHGRFTKKRSAFIS